MIKNTLFICFVMILIGSYGFTSENDKLIINESKDNYIMTVPVSNLTMIVPKAYFTRYQEVKNDNPRYFMFADKQNAIFLSGWFEPSESFSSVKQIWEGDVQSWKNKKMPEPDNIKFSKFNNWEIVTYNMDMENANNCHVRAHWIQDNTWIDIHISMTSTMKKEEILNKLMSILKEIKIIKK